MRKTAHSALSRRLFEYAASSARNAENRHRIRQRHERTMMSKLYHCAISGLIKMIKDLFMLRSLIRSSIQD
jgi:hypothetical protein